MSSRLNQIVRAFSFLSVVLLSISPSVFAKGMGNLTGTGVVFPTNGDGSLMANPGRLVSSEKALEVLAEPTGSNFDISGNFVGSSKSMGYGVGFDYVATQKTPFAGLAVGGSKFGLGVKGAYNLDTSTFGLTVGTFVGSGQGFGLGFAAYDVTNGFNAFTGGVGYRAKMFRFELDVSYLKVLTSSTWTLFPNLALDLANGKVSLQAGYSFPMSPTFDFGAGSFTAGAGFWLSNKFALEYTYKGRLGDHQMGLVIAF